MYEKEITFIRQQLGADGFIPLHEPRFRGNEKAYVNECIDSTFVSSVGPFVTRFEEAICAYTGAKYAVAVSNGTSALHLALVVAGVSANDMVITQPLSFVATGNAIMYTGATPAFVDVEPETLGMSPSALLDFLQNECDTMSGATYHKATQRRISACVPMHTFGMPARVDALMDICQKYHITLIEDAAEAVGSIYQGKHCGTVGHMGVFSFNGNKIITSGGGGVIVTDDEKKAKRAKHLSTQAKVPHPWHFSHDAVGYNYRMPNLNAALALAQLEQLPDFIASKRALAEKYIQFFSQHTEAKPVTEPKDSRANYWLFAVMLPNMEKRDLFLHHTNEHGVMTRPTWDLLHTLPIFSKAVVSGSGVYNAREIAEHLVNIPSSVI